MDRFLTPEQRWWGGHYELEMELGERSDTRLAAALQALWSHPGLEGPYAERDREPNDQPPVDPASGLAAHLRGVATLPDGARVACGSWTLRLPPDEAGSARGAHRESMFFYLPIASLAAVWPHIGRFPFPEPADENDPEFPFPDLWRRVDDQPWQEPLEEWFAEVGRWVFEQVPFRLGLVGFEIDLDDEERARWSENDVPDDHPLGVLRPNDGGVQWHSSTKWGRYEPGWGDEHHPWTRSPD